MEKEGSQGRRYRKFPPVVRLIASILVITFIAQDIAWAHPDSLISEKVSNNKLAPEFFSRHKISIIKAYARGMDRLVLKTACEASGKPLEELSLDDIKSATYRLAEEGDRWFPECRPEYNVFDDEVVINFPRNCSIRYFVYDPTNPNLDRYRKQKILTISAISAKSRLYKQVLEGTVSRKAQAARARPVNAKGRKKRTSGRALTYNVGNASFGTGVLLRHNLVNMMVELFPKEMARRGGYYKRMKGEHELKRDNKNGVKITEAIRLLKKWAAAKGADAVRLVERLEENLTVIEVDVPSGLLACGKDMNGNPYWQVTHIGKRQGRSYFPKKYLDRLIVDDRRDMEKLATLIYHDYFEIERYREVSPPRGERVTSDQMDSIHDEAMKVDPFGRYDEIIRESDEKVDGAIRLMSKERNSVLLDIIIAYVVYYFGILRSMIRREVKPEARYLFFDLGRLYTQLGFYCDILKQRNKALRYYNKAIAKLKKVGLKDSAYLPLLAQERVVYLYAKEMMLKELLTELDRLTDHAKFRSEGPGILSRDDLRYERTFFYEHLAKDKRNSFARIRDRVIAILSEHIRNEEDPGKNTILKGVRVRVRKMECLSPDESKPGTPGEQDAAVQAEPEKPGEQDMAAPKRIDSFKKPEDGTTPTNSFVRWHIAEERAVEIDEKNQAVRLIRVDRSNPRIPELEDKYRQNGTFEKLRKAKDPAMLREILETNENFGNLTPEEKRKVVDKVQALPLSLILGYVFVRNSTDTCIAHVRSGFSKRWHGLESTFWMGELLFEDLNSEEIGQFMLEEAQHIVKNFRKVDGEWIHFHAPKEMKPTDPEAWKYIFHNEDFVSTLYNRGWRLYRSRRQEVTAETLSFIKALADAEPARKLEAARRLKMLMKEEVFQYQYGSVWAEKHSVLKVMPPHKSGFLFGDRRYPVDNYEFIFDLPVWPVPEERGDFLRTAEWFMSDRGRGPPYSERILRGLHGYNFQSLADIVGGVLSGRTTTDFITGLRHSLEAASRALPETGRHPSQKKPGETDMSMPKPDREGQEDFTSGKIREFCELNLDELRDLPDVRQSRIFKYLKGVVRRHPTRIGEVAGILDSIKEKSRNTTISIDTVISCLKTIAQLEKGIMRLENWDESEVPVFEFDKKSFWIEQGFDLDDAEIAAGLVRDAHMQIYELMRRISIETIPMREYLDCVVRIICLEEFESIPSRHKTDPRVYLGHYLNSLLHERKVPDAELPAPQDLVLEGYWDNELEILGEAVRFRGADMAREFNAVLADMRHEFVARGDEFDILPTREALRAICFKIHRGDWQRVNADMPNSYYEFDRPWDDLTIFIRLHLSGEIRLPISNAVRYWREGLDWEALRGKVADDFFTNDARLGNMVVLFWKMCRNIRSVRPDIDDDELIRALAEKMNLSGKPGEQDIAFGKTPAGSGTVSAENIKTSYNYHNYLSFFLVALVGWSPILMKWAVNDMGGTSLVFTIFTTNAILVSLPAIFKMIRPSPAKDKGWTAHFASLGRKEKMYLFASVTLNAVGSIFYYHAIFSPLIFSTLIGFAFILINISTQLVNKYHLGGSITTANILGISMMTAASIFSIIHKGGSVVILDAPRVLLLAGLFCYTVRLILQRKLFNSLNKRDAPADLRTFLKNRGILRLNYILGAAIVGIFAILLYSGVIDPAWLTGGGIDIVSQVNIARRAGTLFVIHPAALIASASFILNWYITFKIISTPDRKYRFANFLLIGSLSATATALYDSVIHMAWPAISIAITAGVSIAGALIGSHKDRSDPGVKAKPGEQDMSTQIASPKDEKIKFEKEWIKKAVELTGSILEQEGQLGRGVHPDEARPHKCHSRSILLHHILDRLGIESDIVRVEYRYPDTGEISVQYYLKTKSDMYADAFSEGPRLTADLGEGVVLEEGDIGYDRYVMREKSAQVIEVISTDHPLIKDSAFFKDLGTVTEFHKDRIEEFVNEFRRQAHAKFGEQDMAVPQGGAVLMDGLQSAPGRPFQCIADYEQPIDFGVDYLSYLDRHRSQFGWIWPILMPHIMRRSSVTGEKNISVGVLGSGTGEESARVFHEIVTELTKRGEDPLEWDIIIYAVDKNREVLDEAQRRISGRHPLSYSYDKDYADKVISTLNRYGEKFRESIVPHNIDIYDRRLFEEAPEPDLVFANNVLSKEHDHNKREDMVARLDRIWKNALIVSTNSDLGGARRFHKILVAPKTEFDVVNYLAIPTAITVPAHPKKPAEQDMAAPKPQIQVIMIDNEKWRAACAPGKSPRTVIPISVNFANFYSATDEWRVAGGDRGVLHKGNVSNIMLLCGPCIGLILHNKKTGMSFTAHYLIVPYDTTREGGIRLASIDDVPADIDQIIGVMKKGEEDDWVAIVTGGEIAKGESLDEVREKLRKRESVALYLASKGIKNIEQVFPGQVNVGVALRFNRPEARHEEVLNIEHDANPIEPLTIDAYVAQLEAAAKPGEQDMAKDRGSFIELGDPINDIDEVPGLRTAIAKSKEVSSALWRECEDVLKDDERGTCRFRWARNMPLPMQVYEDNGVFWILIDQTYNSQRLMFELSKNGWMDDLIMHHQVWLDLTLRHMQLVRDNKLNGEGPKAVEIAKMYAARTILKRFDDIDRLRTKFVGSGGGTGFAGMLDEVCSNGHPDRFTLFYGSVLCNPKVKGEAGKIDRYPSRLMERMGMALRKIEPEYEGSGRVRDIAGIFYWINPIDGKKLAKDICDRVAREFPNCMFDRESLLPDIILSYPEQAALLRVIREEPDTAIGRDAANAMIYCHIKLVLSELNNPKHKRLRRKQGMDDDDIKQDAWTITTSALRSFNPGEGVNFSTYLVNSLNNSLYGLSERKQEKLARSGHKVNSFKEYDEDGYSEVYTISQNRENEPTVEAVIREAPELVKRLLGRLSPRARLFIKLLRGIRYDGDAEREWTTEEIGRLDGISGQRVRQVIERAMEMIDSGAGSRDAAYPLDDGDIYLATEIGVLPGSELFGALAMQGKDWLVTNAAELRKVTGSVPVAEAVSETGKKWTEFKSELERSNLRLKESASKEARAIKPISRNELEKYQEFRRLIDRFVRREYPDADERLELLNKIAGFKTLRAPTKISSQARPGGKKTVSRRVELTMSHGNFRWSANRNDFSDIVHVVPGVVQGRLNIEIRNAAQDTKFASTQYSSYWDEDNATAVSVSLEFRDFFKDSTGKIPAPERIMAKCGSLEQGNGAITVFRDKDNKACLYPAAEYITMPAGGGKDINRIFWIEAFQDERGKGVNIRLLPEGPPVGKAYYLGGKFIPEPGPLLRYIYTGMSDSDKSNNLTDRLRELKKTNEIITVKRKAWKDAEYSRNGTKEYKMVISPFGVSRWKGTRVVKVSDVPDADAEYFVRFRPCDDSFEVYPDERCEQKDLIVKRYYDLESGEIHKTPQELQKRYKGFLRGSAPNPIVIYPSRSGKITLDGKTWAYIGRRYIHKPLLILFGYDPSARARAVYIYSFNQDPKNGGRPSRLVKVFDLLDGRNGSLEIIAKPDFKPSMLSGIHRLAVQDRAYRLGYGQTPVGLSKGEDMGDDLFGIPLPARTAVKTQSEKPAEQDMAGPTEKDRVSQDRASAEPTDKMSLETQDEIDVKVGSATFRVRRDIYNGIDALTPSNFSERDADDISTISYRLAERGYISVDSVFHSNEVREDVMRNYGRTVYFVWRQNDRIVAYCMERISKRNGCVEAGIEHLVVREDLENRGIGTALLAFASNHSAVTYRVDAIALRAKAKETKDIIERAGGFIYAQDRSAHILTLASNDASNRRDGSDAGPVPPPSPKRQPKSGEQDMTSDGALKAINDQHVQLIQTEAVPSDKRVILSANLFRPKAGDSMEESIEATENKTALMAVLNKANISILEPEEIRKVVVGNDINRNNLTIVMTDDDFRGTSIFNNSQKASWEKSNVLMLEDRLIGTNYLYLQGVIGLAQALMRDDDKAMMAAKLLYRMMTGKVMNDEMLDSARKNPIAFAANNMLKFKPIEPRDTAEFDTLRRNMEKSLTAA